MNFQRYVIDRLFASAMDAVKITAAGAYKWAYENHGEDAAEQLLNALRDFVGQDDDGSTA